MFKTCYIIMTLCYVREDAVHTILFSYYDFLSHVFIFYISTSLLSPLSLAFAKLRIDNGIISYHNIIGMLTGYLSLKAGES